MFTDPQSVTVNAVAQSMPRVSSSKPVTVGQFSTADGAFTMQVRQYGTAKRFRREIAFTQRKIAADPLTAVNSEVSASFTLVFDTPKTGFSNAELAYLSAGLISWFSASTYAKQTQLLGGEL